MPFRDAHHVTGSLVALAEAEKCELQDLSLTQMHSVDPAITKEVYDVLGVENSVASRISYGGTAPAQVRAPTINMVSAEAMAKAADDPADPATEHQQNRQQLTHDQSGWNAATASEDLP